MDAARAQGWANPASIHGPGRQSRALLEQARQHVAAAIGASPADVVLTGGGTEACNLGVLGVVDSFPAASTVHVVASTIEHPAAAEPLRHCESSGRATVSWFAVPAGRAPDAAALRACFTADTRMLVVQWVNHETGTILPVQAYAEACRSAGALCIIDATQALGKLPVNVAALGADVLAFAAHKLGGPAGAGALWVRRSVQLSPRMLGGAQERGRRAGTPDVVAQVGFGLACELAAERVAAQPRIAALRDAVERGLRELGGLSNAADGARVATVSNSSWRGWRGEALIAALDIEGIACSSGAACSSGTSEPSRVLAAMYPDEAWRAGSALRLSFGVESTESDVESVLTALRRVVARPPA